MHKWKQQVSKRGFPYQCRVLENETSIFHSFCKKSIHLFQCKRCQYFNNQTVESLKLNSICIGKNIRKPGKRTSLLLRRRPETEWMFAPNSPDDHKQPDPSTDSVLTNAPLKNTKWIDIELLGKPSSPPLWPRKNLTLKEWKNILFLAKNKWRIDPFVSNTLIGSPVRNLKYTGCFF